MLRDRIERSIMKRKRLSSMLAKECGHVMAAQKNILQREIMAELSTLELAKVDSCQTLLSEWEMVTTNPPFPTSVWQLLLLTKKKCHHDPITLQCLTPYTPTSQPSSTEVQSESISRSQGLGQNYPVSRVTLAKTYQGHESTGSFWHYNPGTQISNRTGTMDRHDEKQYCHCACPSCLSNMQAHGQAR